MSNDSPQPVYSMSQQLQQQQQQQQQHLVNPPPNSIISTHHNTTTQPPNTHPLPSMYSIINLHLPPSNPQANMDMLASTASLRDLPQLYLQPQPPPPAPPQSLPPQMEYSYLQNSNIASSNRSTPTITDTIHATSFVPAPSVRSMAVENTPAQYQTFHTVQQNVAETDDFDLSVEEILLKLNSGGSVIRGQVLDRLIPVLAECELESLLLLLQKNNKAVERMKSWNCSLAEPKDMQQTNCTVTMEGVGRFGAQNEMNPAAPASAVSGHSQTNVVSVFPLTTSHCRSTSTQTIPEDFAHCDTCSCHKKAIQNKPYQCETCLKRFSKWRTLKVHMKNHSEEGSFTCKLCDKSFSRRDQLDIHERIHTNERPYPCTVCGKSFRGKGALQNHLYLHTGVKPHKCHFCDKCFSIKSNLDCHIKLHTGDAPFVCEVCSKSYIRKDYLVSHMKAAHSEKKPFSCQYCGKQFSWKNTLKKHEEKHIDPKSYTCEQCGKKYPAKKNLRMHMKIHTGVNFSPHAYENSHWGEAS